MYFMYLFLPFSFKKINVLILIEGSLLYNIVTVFALHQHESAKVTHVSPPSWTPFPPPSPPCPSGLSQSTGFGCPLHALNLHWSSVLHMGVYMFHCSSLKSSHPRLLSPSRKVCSVSVCRRCFPACRIVATVFLNSIYICINMSICLSLSDWLLSV